MKIGFNLCTPSNKGCRALDNALAQLVHEVCPEAVIQPYPSGYTDEHFDAYICIGGDSPTYWDTVEFDVTRNAIKNGVPSLGLGLDLSPRLGRYTDIPAKILRYMSLMDQLTVRSSGSQDLLKRYNVPNTKIPDLAWCLNAQPCNYIVPENTIAFSAYQPVERLTEWLKGLIWELKAQGYTVLQLIEDQRSVPMDHVEATPVDATWEQNITILSKCKALITTGFHAAICGYKAGIPVMTLPVQEKTYWLAEELNLPKPLPFAAIQSPRYICNELQKLIDNPPKVEIPKHDKTIELIKGFFDEYVTGFSDNQ